MHARHGASADEFDADLLAVADTEPEIVVDDGAELTAGSSSTGPRSPPGSPA